jgi:trk system potassium uptake protein TrkH
MRYKQYLRQRYRAMLGYAGEILVFLGLLYLTPLLLLIFYPAESQQAGGFLVVALPLILLGLLLRARLTPAEPVTLNVQEGAVVVVGIWLVAILTGALPFMLILGTPFTPAVFESTSGWTGTGITVIDVAATPNILLFFRSFSQFAGGAGFVIIALSAAAGALGTSLSAAEGRTDQLAPHIRQSAGIVLGLYTGYAVFGILALRVAGMDWFDSVNHAFTAIGTGGFSNRPEGVLAWADNPAVEIVLIILMLLGAVNFFLAWTFFRRKFRPVLRSGEIRLMALLIGLSVLGFVGLVAPELGLGGGEAALKGTFEVVSAISTTGFAATDHRQWVDFGWVILLLLMLIGANSGSTGGGIKSIRIYLLYKAVRWEIQRAFMPAHMLNEPAIWQGEQRRLLSDKQVRQVGIFVALYLTVFFAGVLLMTAYGYGLRESMYEYASTLAGAGLSVGVTRPDSPALVLWSQIAGMLLGRLEYFTVFIGIIKFGADARDMVWVREG